MIKNFPFIPLIMWTTLMMVIIHGHKVSRQNKSKVEYSMAAGVDAHLTAARSAFLAADDFTFEKELGTATKLLSKEAHCENCIDKEVAKESLAPLLSIKHKFQRDNLQLGDMDSVFGKIITALAKNHIIYTLEHISDLEDEFYLEDAIRHLKFSMKYLPENVQEKERVATQILEEALVKHKLDPEQTKKILNEVVSSI